MFNRTENRFGQFQGQFQNNTFGQFNQAGGQTSWQDSNLDPSEFVPDQGAGFVTGTGNESPVHDSPMKGKTKRGDTLTPVTVNQLFYSATPMGGQEEGFMLDGKLLGYVCVIGQVLERQEHEANITLTVDDSSGTIDIKVWVDTSDPNDYLYQQSPEWQPGTFVKVIGTLKSFGAKRNLGAYSIAKVTDFNMLTLHLLDVIFVHLYNTKGPLAPFAGQQQRVQQDQAQQDQALADSGFTDLQLYIMEFVGNGPQDTGVAVTDLAGALAPYEIPEAEIREQLAWLTDEGHLFTTIDEEHFAVTGQA